MERASVELSYYLRQPVVERLQLRLDQPWHYGDVFEEDSADGFEFGARRSTLQATRAIENVVLNLLHPGDNGSSGWPTIVDKWQRWLAKKLLEETVEPDTLAQLFRRIAVVDPSSASSVSRLLVMLQDYAGERQELLLSSMYWPAELLDCDAIDMEIRYFGSDPVRVTWLGRRHRVQLPMTGQQVWCDDGQLSFLRQLFDGAMPLSRDNLGVVMWALRRGIRGVCVDVHERCVRFDASVAEVYDDVDLLPLLMDGASDDKENKSQESLPLAKGSSTPPPLANSPAGYTERWPFVKAMLTNLGPMSAARILQTLLMFGGGSGSDSGEDEESSLTAFLDDQVIASLLAYDADTCTYCVV